MHSTTPFERGKRFQDKCIIIAILPATNYIITFDSIQHTP